MIIPVMINNVLGTSFRLSNDDDLPEVLQEEIRRLRPKARNIRPLILKLCVQRAYSAEEIANIFNRNMRALTDCNYGYWN